MRQPVLRDSTLDIWDFSFITSTNTLVHQTHRYASGTCNANNVPYHFGANFSSRINVQQISIEFSLHFCLASVDACWKTMENKHSSILIGAVLGELRWSLETQMFYESSLMVADIFLRLQF